jgi:hypothetical protein
MGHLKRVFGADLHQVTVSDRHLLEHTQMQMDSKDKDKIYEHVNASSSHVYTYNIVYT